MKILIDLEKVVRKQNSRRSQEIDVRQGGTGVVAVLVAAEEQYTANYVVWSLAWGFGLGEIKRVQARRNFFWYGEIAMARVAACGASRSDVREAGREFAGKWLVFCSIGRSIEVELSFGVGDFFSR